MRIARTLLPTFLILLSVPIGPQTAPSRTWAPAKYRGLVMGQSKRGDVYRVLGKPKWVGREEDTDIPLITYDVTYPVRGELEVYITKGILEGMTLSLKNPLTVKEAIRLLGHDYLDVHYSSDECLGEGGAAPIYEDPNGDLEHLEFRSRGLAASIHDYNKVEEIIYTYKPFGSTHSLCKDKKQKKQSPK